MTIYELVSFFAPQGFFCEHHQLGRQWHSPWASALGELYLTFLKCWLILSSIWRDPSYILSYFSHKFTLVGVVMWLSRVKTWNCIHLRSSYDHSIPILIVTPAKMLCCYTYLSCYHYLKVEPVILCVPQSIQLCPPCVDPSKLICREDIFITRSQT